MGNGKTTSISQPQTMTNLMLNMTKEIQYSDQFHPFLSSLPLFGTIQRNDMNGDREITSTTFARFAMVEGREDSIGDILDSGTCETISDTLRNELGITSPLEMTAGTIPVVNGADSAQIAWDVLWTESNQYWRENFFRHYVIGNFITKAVGSGQILGAWRRVCYVNRMDGSIRRDADFDFSPTGQPVCFVARSEHGTEYRTPSGIKVIDQRPAHRGHLIALALGFDSSDSNSVQRFAWEHLCRLIGSKLDQDADRAIRQGLTAFNGQAYLPSEKLFAGARVIYRRMAFANTDFRVEHLPSDLDLFNPYYVVLGD